MSNIYIGSWPLPDHRSRPENLDVEGAIVHSMGEWILNLEDGKRYYSVTWLKKLGYSVHAVIVPNGTVIKCIPESRVAFHAGESEFKNFKNLNHTFLGCEFAVEGIHTWSSYLEKIKTPEAYTEEQYKSGGYLYSLWSKNYPNINKETIVAHSFVSGDDVRGPGKGKPDPGPGFNWDRFWFWYEHFMKN